MSTLEYYYYSITILFLYLVILLLRKEYRLVLPSTAFCAMWLITCVLVVFQIKGIFVGKTSPESKFALVAPFTFYISLASVLGFSTAHLLTNKSNQNYRAAIDIDIELLEFYLKRFRWVPYLCGATGFALSVFLITTIGSVESFSDYRIMALYTERVGYAAVAQRISGHINILGLFYLMIYGYVCGQRGIVLKQFLWIVFLCSLINIAIGGRVWILTSLLPFFTTYILSIKNNSSSIKDKSSNKKLFLISIIFISLFSILGIARGGGNERFMDKFLYLTDGSRMTNLMLGYYPEGTFEHEYGSSTLLDGFSKSPMVLNFADRISDDIGLSVTVKSILPNLYYDFGIYGGAIYMGILCCILELLCLYFRYSNSIFNLICYGTLAGFLVQSPVGNVFTLYTPTFEWLIMIFIFRKWIFNKGMTSKLLDS